MKSTRASGTTTPLHTDSARPLVLLHANTTSRISIPVPSTANEWTAAEVARDTFQDWLHEQDAEGSLIGLDVVELDEDNPHAASEDTLEKELVLTAYFISHVVGLLSTFPSSTSASTSSILLASFSYFVRTFLSETDVHSLGASFPAPICSLVISSYFAARTKLEIAGLRDELPKVRGSALLREASEGTSELYAVFGGQGMNEVYFDELQVSSGPLVAGEVVY